MQSRLLPVLTTLIVLTSVGAGRTVDAQSSTKARPCESSSAWRREAATTRTRE